jgi:MFS family permease
MISDFRLTAPYIASAFLGCWLSDPLNNYIGRRGTIFVSAIFLILTPIGGAVSQTWEQLFITRLLMGIGMGLKGATTPIFAAENSPAAIRGALVMTWFGEALSLGQTRASLTFSQANVGRFWYFSRLLRQSCCP